MGSFGIGHFCLSAVISRSRDSSLLAREPVFNDWMTGDGGGVVGDGCGIIVPAKPASRLADRARLLQCLEQYF